MQAMTVFLSRTLVYLTIVVTFVVIKEERSDGNWVNWSQMVVVSRTS